MHEGLIVDGPAADGQMKLSSFTEHATVRIAVPNEEQPSLTIEAPGFTGPRTQDVDYEWRDGAWYWVSPQRAFDQLVDFVESNYRMVVDFVDEFDAALILTRERAQAHAERVLDTLVPGRSMSVRSALQQDFGSSRREHATSYDAAVIERTEFCWKNVTGVPCGEVASEESETGLCAMHHSEVRDHCRIR